MFENYSLGIQIAYFCPSLYIEFSVIAYLNDGLASFRVPQRELIFPVQSATSYLLIVSELSVVVNRRTASTAGVWKLLRLSKLQLSFWYQRPIAM